MPMVANRKPDPGNVAYAERESSSMFRWRSVIRLPQELADKLTARSIRDNVSKNEVMMRAVEAYLDE